MKSDKKKGAD